jgi:hypothetical protein
MGLLYRPVITLCNCWGFIYIHASEMAPWWLYKVYNLPSVLCSLKFLFCCLRSLQCLLRFTFFVKVEGEQRVRRDFIMKMAVFWIDAPCRI